jgi:CRISPR-associated protein Cas2
MTYIVSYDIANDKRLREVYKICKNFGSRLQYSVFECDLSKVERADLEAQLSGTILDSEDQVLFIPLGPADSRGTRAITALGLPCHKFDDPCYVA